LGRGGGVSRGGRCVGGGRAVLPRGGGGSPAPAIPDIVLGVRLFGGDGGERFAGAHQRQRNLDSGGLLEFPRGHVAPLGRHGADDVHLLLRRRGQGDEPQGRNAERIAPTHNSSSRLISVSDPRGNNPETARERQPMREYDVPMLCWRGVTHTELHSNRGASKAASRQLFQPMTSS